MLENPYNPASPAGDVSGRIYRGEGRIDESADGSTMAIWWDETLDDALDGQWRLTELMGILAQVRKYRWFRLLLMVVLFTLAYINTYYGKNPPDLVELIFRTFFWTGGTLMLLGVLGGLLYSKESLRKTIVKYRGTTGTIETGVQIEPSGVRSLARQLETFIHWPRIQEIEVTATGLFFIGDPLVLLYVPLRLFPDANSVERFVALGEKYMGLRNA